MDQRSKIIELIEGAFESPDLFLVDLKLSTSKIHRKVTLLIDSDKGLSIDTCGQLSRKISEPLDLIMKDEPYTLEVSSPGIDQPLKLSRQFQKNIGRNLTVTLNNGETLKGKLEEVKKDLIKIEGLPTETSIEDIKEAKVQISFK